MSRVDQFFFDLGQHGGWFLWLIHQPLWLIATIVIGLGTMVTVAGILLTHNYVTSQRLIGNNLVATAKFAFISEVFAGLLAFMMVEAGTRYANAVAHIQSETAALRNLAQVVEQFPPAVTEPFRTALSDYSRAVVETEWERMKTGDDSPFAADAFDALVRGFFVIEPRDDHEQSLLSLGNLFVAQVVEARTSRHQNNVSQEIAALTWVSLWGLVSITIVFNWFFGTPRLISQLVMGAVLSVSILSCVVLVFLLGNPFAGQTAIKPTPFLPFYRS